MGELDQITIATRAYVSKYTSKLIDGIFSNDPLLAHLRKPQFVGDEEDDFDLWANEVRKEAGVI